MAEGRSLCVLTAGAPSPARPRSPGSGPPQPTTKPLIYEFDFDFVMRRGNFSQPALVYSEDRAVPAEDCGLQGLVWWERPACCAAGMTGGLAARR